MRRKRAVCLMLLAAAALLIRDTERAMATLDCAADAMIVFDGSASMEEVGFDVTEATRISEAREAVRRAVPDIAPFRRLGLIVYGPGGADSCSGIDLRFAPRADAAGAVTDAIDRLKPGGLTPLAASVAEAARVLDHRRRPGVIVLVTDGNETCGGAPCALAEALLAEAVDLTVHVIGFRVRVDFFTWNNPEQKPLTGGEPVARCLADRTGGRFVTTETVDELVAALQATLGCPAIGQTQTPPATAGGVLQVSHPARTRS